MIGKAIALVALTILPTLSFAETCGMLKDFATNGLLPAPNGVEAYCTVSRVLGAGRSEDCFWRYPLRSDVARDQFETMRVQLRACADGPVEVQATGVNHPDSFDQMTGQVNGIAVSLSLKDKGGLAQTLVVLRRQLP